MAKHHCEHCRFRAKYDTNPRSIVGRLWRWHIGFCPGWKAFLRDLAPEARVQVEQKYSLRPGGG